MPEVFTDEAGAPIAPEDLAAAMSQGKAFGAPDADYTLRDASGQVVKVKGAEVPKALGSGFSIVPPDQARIEEKRHELESAPVATAIERVGSTVTLGGLDWAARKLDPQFADDMADRAAVNTGVADVATVAGMLAPNRAVGAVGGLVGKLTKGLGAETAAGRMALRAAQGAGTGALEGALYGAGNELSSASLKDEELTAEKLLSGGAHGAVFGALLGGVGGAVAGKLENLSLARGVAREGDALLARKTADLTAKLRKDGVAEAQIADRVASELGRVEKRSSAIQEFANAQALKSTEASPKLLKERAARAGMTVDELVQQAGQDYLGYEMKSGPLEGKRIFHGASKPIDAIDDVAHALKETRADVGHFEEMAARSAEANPAVLPDVAPVQAQINAILAPNGKRAPSQFARDVASDIAPVLVAEGKAGIRDLRAASDAVAARIEGTTGKAQLRELSEVKRVLDDTAAAGTRNSLQAAGVDVSKYTEAQRVNRSLSLVKDALDEMKLETKSGKHDGGLTGFVLGSLLTGNVPTSIAAGASLLGGKILRERAGGIAAEVAHRVASSDVRLGWGAKAIAGDAWKVARGATTRAALDPTPLIHRVQELAASNEEAAKFAGELVAGVARQYPNVAQAMTAKLMGDLQYLAAHAPAPVGRGAASMTPGAVASGFPPKAASEWLEKAKALQDPGFVVDEVLNGRVPEAAIAALKERRPMLWEQLRADVAKEVALRSDELPFKRRITIGMAFDFSSDKSLMPGTIRSIQDSAFSGSSEGQAANGMPSAGPGRPAAPKVDIAPMQSMTERIGTGA